MPTAVAGTSRLVRTIAGVLIAGMLMVFGCGPPVGLLPPSASPTAVPLMKLRVGTNTTPTPALTSSILWLAKDLGFYEREGLDVELSEFTGAPVGITALQTGQIDVGNVILLDIVRLNASQTLALRAIGASGSDDFPFIVARDSIQSLAELKGKSYAVSRPGGADDTTARRMLLASGLTDADVNYVTVGAPNQRAQALLAGQIDATTVQVSTWVTLRDKPGLRVLATMDQIRPIVPNSATLNVVTTKTLAAEPEQLRRFTAAIMKTARLFQANQAAWVDAMAVRRPDLARSDLEYLWDEFNTAWGVNGFMNLTQLQKESDYAYQTTPDLAGLPKLSVTDWADTHFVDGVLKDSGVYPGFDDPGRALP